MASEEHVAVVIQGVDAIAAWRATHPDAWLDLREADLYGVNLSGADLHDANLFGADLTDASLTQTNLIGADLYGASLIRTDLSGADLSRANLLAANLTEADLSEARLEMARFQGTLLMQTNFARAILELTIFSFVNLAFVVGLDSVEHSGPSSLDWVTLRASWPLPDSFLRGCGLPDELITYLPSLLSQAPIQYYPVFISYSSKDEAFAMRLHADLQENNVRCWFAPEDLPIGAKIRTGIDEAIRVHDKLLLILSEHSIASPWVEHEVERALKKERDSPGTLVLFPIRLDDAISHVNDGWANDVLTRNIWDFSRWKEHDAYQAAFQRVLRDLKASESGTGA